jgi:hypothetical protein
VVKKTSSMLRHWLRNAVWNVFRNPDSNMTGVAALIGHIMLWLHIRETCLFSFPRNQCVSSRDLSHRPSAIDYGGIASYSSGAKVCHYENQSIFLMLAWDFLRLLAVEPRASDLLTARAGPGCCCCWQCEHASDTTNDTTNTKPQPNQHRNIHAD